MTNARLAALDMLRGIAVLAMIFYHFSWDLSWFQLVDWPVTDGSEWRAFAAAIAGSFLFLSGMTLAFAHGQGIRWKKLIRSKLLLLVSACMISLITYMIFSDNFVRFGILHCLFLAGLLSLPFLDARWFVTLTAGLVVVSLPFWAKTPFFDGQFWLWTGLGTPDFGSVDYVPLAPWAGIALLGTALVQSPVWGRLAARGSSERSGNAISRCLSFLGRHSLLIYLLHQPALFGALLLMSEAGVLPDPSKARFVESCSELCALTEGNTDACQATCSCTLDKLVSGNLWEPLVQSPDDPELRKGMNDAYAICLRDTQTLTFSAR